MLKLPFFINMVHFLTTLKPIHNNLSIKKDKVFLTYQTEDDGSLKKEGKRSKLWVQVKNFPSILPASTQPQSQPKIESKPLKTKLCHESSWLL